MGGYRLRKLNQAYFAFRGNYAESPASVSPIGDQLKELRSFLPSVGAFITTMSEVSTYQEFLNLLEKIKAQAEGKTSLRMKPYFDINSPRGDSYLNQLPRSV